MSILAEIYHKELGLAKERITALERERDKLRIENEKLSEEVEYYRNMIAQAHIRFCLQDSQGANKILESTARREIDK